VFSAVGNGIRRRDDRASRAAPTAASTVGDYRHQRALLGACRGWTARRHRGRNAGASLFRRGRGCCCICDGFSRRRWPCQSGRGGPRLWLLRAYRPAAFGALLGRRHDGAGDTVGVARRTPSTPEPPPPRYRAAQGGRCEQPRDRPPAGGRREGDSQAGRTVGEPRAPAASSLGRSRPRGRKSAARRDSARGSTTL